MSETITRNPYAMKRYPLLIVISGPSGVGKDSVVQRMMEKQVPFHFVITATSRPPRSEEVHGVDYFFVSEQEFRDMIERDELLEHALVYGQYKGIRLLLDCHCLYQRCGCWGRNPFSVSFSQRPGREAPDSNRCRSIHSRPLCRALDYSWNPRVQE